MNRLNQYLQAVKKDFERKYPAGPKLVVNIKESSTGDSFKTGYAGGVVTLEAATPQAAIFGTELISAGVASGHLPDYLGEKRSRFPLRPLWLTGLKGVEDLPLEAMCKKILKLGYNAVLFECHEDEKESLSKLTMLRDYGLKVILKLKLPPQEGQCILDSQYKDEVQRLLHTLQNDAPHLDGFFWEGEALQKELHRHPAARDLLQVDMALKEVRMLEEAILGERFLIYHLPSPDLQAGQSQADWFSSFCDDVGKHTIIAFSALAGEAHSFWEVLRRSLDPFYTLLMPIIDICPPNQEEGLWPILTLDSVCNFLLRCTRHKFAGALFRISHVPDLESPLCCNLWVASQALWGETASELSADTWFAAFRPDLNYSHLKRAMIDVRKFSVELSLMGEVKECTPEECRMKAQELLSLLTRV